MPENGIQEFTIVDKPRPAQPSIEVGSPVRTRDELPPNLGSHARVVDTPFILDEDGGGEIPITESPGGKAAAKKQKFA